jgi:hypothetical protein
MPKRKPHCNLYENASNVHKKYVFMLCIKVKATAHPGSPGLNAGVCPEGGEGKVAAHGARGGRRLSAELVLENI